MTFLLTKLNNIMSLLDAFKNVTNVAKEQMADLFKDDDEEDTMSVEEEKEEKENYASPRYESLRPLLRMVLMKDEMSDKDREILKRKAVSLGMDADEFELLFEGMVAEKKKYATKSLFGKVNYNAFFGDEDDMDDEMSPFDICFEAAFYSEKEKQCKKARLAREDAEEMKSLGGLGSLMNLMG